MNSLGQYHDEETDLYYNWHRYYEPTLGRYYQADKLASEDFKRTVLLKNLKFLFNNSKYYVNYLVIDRSLNSYSYVDNNPFIGFDPLGLFDNKEYYNDLNWWDKLERGYYYGTGFGEEAVDYYAQRYLESGNWLWGIPGSFAALWTKETWLYTAISISAAGLTQITGLSNQGPWLGAVVFHSAHAAGPHQYAHIQIMIRTGLHHTSYLRIPLQWLMKYFKQ